MELIMDPDLMAEQRAVANSWPPLKLLELLGPSQCHPMFNGDLAIEEWPLPDKITFEEDGMKGLGALTSLPAELMILIITMLDLPSAIEFSAVCRTANAFVQQSPVPFIKQWAPDMLWYLKNSYIHGDWTVGNIQAALRSDHCVSCGESCNRIFLATMERVCQPCVVNNHAYWCLPIQDASKVFGLSPMNMPKTRPIYIPGLSSRDLGPRDREAWVVPIKSALALALQLHGSRRGIERAVNASLLVPYQADGNEHSDDEQLVIRNHSDLYRSASLKPLTPAELRVPLATRYPHVPRRSPGISLRTFVVPCGNTQKILRSCRGCAAMMTNPKPGLLSEPQMEALRLDPGLNPREREMIICRRAFRVWDFDDMMDHLLNECLGGWSLIRSMNRSNDH